MFANKSQYFRELSMNLYISHSIIVVIGHMISILMLCYCNSLVLKIHEKHELLLLVYRVTTAFVLF